MAETIIEGQAHEVAKVPDAQMAIAELSFDETQCFGLLDGKKSSQNLYSMLMAHMVLTLILDIGRRLTHDVIIPPGFIASTTGAVAAASLLKRLPISLADMKRKCKTLIVLILSDSARACIKVARYFAMRTKLHADMDGVLCLHVVCLMHMSQLCIGAVFKFLYLINAMFCASILLQQARLWGAILDRTRQHLKGAVQIVCGKHPSAARHEEYLRQVLLLLEVDASTLDVTGSIPMKNTAATKQARKVRRDRLSKSISSSVFKEDRLLQFKHYCPFGCHLTEQDARDEIADDFEALVFRSTPTIPALNRWTKLYPAR